MESKGNTRGENNCEIAFSRVACACAGLHILKKYIRQGLVSVSMLKFLVLGTHERASQNENGAREKTWTIEGVRMTAWVAACACGRVQSPSRYGGYIQYTAYTPATRRARSMFPRAGEATHTTTTRRDTRRGRLKTGTCVRYE